MMSIKSKLDHLAMQLEGSKFSVISEVLAVTNFRFNDWILTASNFSLVFGSIDSRK